MLRTPKRIALVGPLPPPSGGMANQTKQLQRLLASEGVQVTVVQVNAPYSPRWIGRVRGLRACARLVPYIVSLWRAARRVELFHIMANSGWSWHLFAAPAVWIAKLHGCPVIVNYRGGEADRFFQRSFRIVKPTLNRASVVVVPSAFLHDVFERWGIGSVIVPNIIDLSRFYPAEPIVVPGRERGPHVIVTRNLEPIYDIETALRVFALVKSRWTGARLTVAGSGPELNSLKSTAHALGVADSVEFVGRLDNEDIPKLYRSADIMLNTSLVDNMPISFLEAMASGVPIVSTDVGGIPYLVKHGEQALLAPPRDVSRLAGAIEQLWEQEEQRVRMAKAGIDLARQFEWRSVRERLFSVYASVVSNCAAEVAERGDA